MVCAACGSSNLVEGKLVDGHGDSVFFMIAEGSRWRKIIGKQHRKVIAFACVHCGNLQHQVKFTDLDRAVREVRWSAAECC
jgi:predicted nucleic-acid-binding Zn-ribbon protein